VLKDRVIECDRDQIREGECGDDAAQQRPSCASDYPYYDYRPEQGENMRLGHGDEQRRTCKKWTILREQKKKGDTQ
jgi:hypothetical protein